MLKQTNGVFLRDVNPSAISSWKFNNETEWECSKDQILGLITCIFAMYTSTTHEVLKTGLRDIVRQINDNLAKHKWFLYNEQAKRGYNSANYSMIHYWGMRKAISHMLGRRKVSFYEVFYFLLGKFFVRTNVLCMARAKGKEFIWQKLKFLERFSWYGDYFRAGMYDFNLNLCFMEMYIAATLSKRNAKWCLRLLKHKEAMRTNNLNFAFLYDYISKRYPDLDRKNINDTLDRTVLADSHYTSLRAIDSILHMGGIPNELTWPGWGESCLYSHEIYDYFHHNYIPQISISKLMKESNEKSIRINNGLTYLAREV